MKFIMENNLIDSNHITHISLSDNREVCTIYFTNNEKLRIEGRENINILYRVFGISTPEEDEQLKKELSGR